MPELPPPAEPGTRYTAVMDTSAGEITLELWPDLAPQTVGNFVGLARQGFYDGTVFHRIIHDFMIQGGCPKGTGTGGPGYDFADEINERKLVTGTLAMANAGPNTNGSQFFIVTAQATPWLDGAHTGFGRVVGGEDVVETPRHHRHRPRRPAPRAPAAQHDPDRGGLTPPAAPSWEVTLLRRPPGARRPRVAARVVLEAPDLQEARRAAEAALDERSGDEARWSLGMLRPLTPMAPGTHRYRATFARWEDDDDRFVRVDVYHCDVWAADAQSARRLAQQEIRKVRGYEPSWRIRQVARIDGTGARARAGGGGAERTAIAAPPDHRRGADRHRGVDGGPGPRRRCAAGRGRRRDRRRRRPGRPRRRRRPAGVGGPAAGRPGPAPWRRTPTWLTRSSRRWRSWCTARPASPSPRPRRRSPAPRR